jgi:hypothetical protein
VSETVAVCVKVELVPVIVNVWLCLGVLLLVLTVMVEEPDLLIEAGLKEAVAPVGSPLALNATVPENPLDGVTLTV